jgi:hypothetical protein
MNAVAVLICTFIAGLLGAATPAVVDHEMMFMNDLLVGNSWTVEVLMWRQLVDPSFKDNQAVIKAAEKGHLAVLRVILGDPRVDPAARQSEALRKACANGHVDVMRALLEDGRADPIVHKNCCVINASKSDHKRIVHLLLKDGRADPTARTYMALRFACLEGHAEVWSTSWAISI